MYPEESSARHRHSAEQIFDYLSDIDIVTALNSLSRTVESKSKLKNACGVDWHRNAKKTRMNCSI